MTSKAFEELCALKIKLFEIRSNIKEHPKSKGRLGSLIHTKLEEAGHWLNDLIVEAIEEESKKNEP